ncbi:unnamed protein product [Clonostachys rosea]|uniref:CBM1 domain-containing protein n=1 Tax=Bionectria ochroleuca TaxID=29856 RepID=A0ABY6UP61_BIOOC|nr:unnamed protein product [Clonostachys rosea]
MAWEAFADLLFPTEYIDGVAYKGPRSRLELTSPSIQHSLNITPTPIYTTKSRLESTQRQNGNTREHTNKAPKYHTMASLIAALLCVAVGFVSIASAAPVAQGFEPPGKECWSNSDCYRAYFCSFPFEGKPGMCTYG